MKGGTVCAKCWTIHIQQGPNRIDCPPGHSPGFTPDEIATIIELARARRIKEDIQAYSRKKAA